MSKADEIIYEIICDIENDFDNKLTVSDIYKKLITIQDTDNIPLEVIMEDDINE